MYATCPAHLIVLDLIFADCRFSQASSPLLGLNILDAMTSDSIDFLQCERSRDTVIKVDGNLYVST
jgi:hypothetical protein